MLVGDAVLARGGVEPPAPALLKAATGEPTRESNTAAVVAPVRKDLLGEDRGVSSLALPEQQQRHRTIWLPLRVCPFACPMVAIAGERGVTLRAKCAGRGSSVNRFGVYLFFFILLRSPLAARFCVYHLHRTCFALYIYSLSTKDQAPPRTGVESHRNFRASTRICDNGTPNFGSSGQHPQHRTNETNTPGCSSG